MADDAPGSAPPVLTPAALQGILSRGRVVISPYPFAVGGADNLRIISFNVAAGVTVEIHGRVAGVDVGGTPFKFTHVPNANGTKLSQDFVLGAGVVTNLAVFATTGAPLPAQCFVIVQLLRQIGAGAFVMGTLLQGSVTSNQCLGWPGSPIVTSTEGEPYVRTVIGTDPAAGVDIIETVPAGRRWELMMLESTQVRDGTSVAAPFHVILDDGANELFHRVSGNVGGATTTNKCSVAQAITSSAVNISGGVCVTEPIPPNRLVAGCRVRLGMIADGTHTDWGAPVYNVREWLEVA